MAYQPQSVLRYEIETSLGKIRADGPDDHQRALESLQSMERLIRLQLEAVERQLLLQRSALDARLGSVPTSEAAPLVPAQLVPPSAAHGVIAGVRRPGSVKLKDALAQHLAEEQRTLTSERTVQEKKALFKEFLDFFGDVWLDEVTQTEITSRWRPAEFNRENRKYAGQTLSPVALQKRHGALNKFFKWAKDLGRY